jgi:hypothetical protein
VASLAPAATIAIAGDEATTFIRAIVLAVLSGSAGRLVARTT